ncbi:MAG: caspase family protein [Candidatus Zixiibacteriota bacterium]|nr:MAG: caspase family protein [candidate division Zixibacteria bacterium]
MMKKALLVGLNSYMNLPTMSLQGAVRDVQDMETMMKKHMGMGDSDIIKLTDAQATKANIMMQMQQMMDMAKSNQMDHLMIMMAGHGTIMPDVMGEDPDRADMAFCAHDLAQMGHRWDPKTMITSEDMVQMMMGMPKTVMVEMIMDMGVSPMMMKPMDMMMDRTPRYMPPPTPEAMMEMEGRMIRTIPMMMMEMGMMNMMNMAVWMASRPDQMAMEMPLDGAVRGVMTHMMMKVMDSTQNRMSRKEMLMRLRANMKEMHMMQIPQMEATMTMKNMPMGSM